ncbi:MAG: hypothetical protein JW982_15005 [Spirochaetes bacterium]|nr:hypothetical protein [Spirochaetota bacterium]
MFSAYFEKLEDKLLKKYSSASKNVKSVKTAAKKVPAATKAVVKTAKSAKVDLTELKNVIDGIIPKEFTLTDKKIADTSGYVADTSDFIICDPKFRAFDDIFRDSVPVEMVKAAFRICPEINRKNLVDTLVDVAHIKKSNHYTDAGEPKPAIPVFAIALDSSYSLKEAKDSIVEIYQQDNVDSLFEFDIMLILGRGIIIKNWRERRSFIALETKMDSLKWFYILMNEYIDLNQSADLRSYVTETKKYDEY